MLPPATEVRLFEAHPAAVLFDCDGVLVDSERITSRIWAGILTEIGLPTTPEQSLATYMGNSMSRCIEIVTGKLGHPPPSRLLPDFHEAVNAALKEEVVAVEGAMELLDLLDQHGIPYAVVSNGEPEKMQTTLGKTGLLARFGNRLYSGAAIGRPKPAPDILLLAARDMKVDCSEAVVVEDSPIGVYAALAAGMRAIGFADIVPEQRLAESGAHVIVKSLGDIPAVLGLQESPHQF